MISSNFFSIFESRLMYLDPGSGSLLLQMLLALFLGIGFAVKVYWKKIRALFQRKSKNDSGSSGDQNQEIQK